MKYASFLFLLMVALLLVCMPILAQAPLPNPPDTRTVPAPTTGPMTAPLPVYAPPAYYTGSTGCNGAQATGCNGAQAVQAASCSGSGRQGLFARHRARRAARATGCGG